MNRMLNKKSIRDISPKGKRVLVLDMDHQDNTTYMLNQHKNAEN